MTPARPRARSATRGQKAPPEAAAMSETPYIRPPSIIAPQFPASARVPPSGAGWVHEIKHDGYRIQARVEDGEVRLYTRGGLDWTKHFRAVADEIGKLKIRDGLIDGEIVALQQDGLSSFQNLQKEIGRRNPRNLHYFAFDLLNLNGRDLRALPLLDRKHALATLIPENAVTLHYVKHLTEEDGAKIIKGAKDLGVEGIVSKRAAASYVPGRGAAWLKTKVRMQQEFVIGGFLGEKTLGSLLVGYYLEGRLIYAGRVGSAFTDRERARLFTALTSIRRPTSPFALIPKKETKAHWVDPALIANVAFLSWTANGLLRHPAFRGVRLDKQAFEVGRDEVPGPPPRKSAKRAPAGRALSLG
jgi:bifunctional non-homologous end joining protein LigD